MISGQAYVESAGSPVVLGEGGIFGPLMVKAVPGNAGEVYIGDDGEGSVDDETGMILEAGDVVVFEYVGDLGSIYVDAENDGDGVCWIALNV
jgi:hypothetical protein